MENQPENSQFENSQFENSQSRRDEHIIVVHRIEEDPIAQQLDHRHTFIPIRCCDLNRKLVQTLDLTPQQRDQFNHLTTRLQAILHAEHLSALLNLEDLYGPLDPDDDAIEMTHLDDQQRDQQVERLIDRFSCLLYSAHYKRLSQDDIESAVQLGSKWSGKLEVDFDIYHRIEIFVRGYRVVEVRRRRWQNFFLEEVIQQPELQRLIMAFRLKPQLDKKGDNKSNFDPNKVYLKTFKNIPETDLEMLLPGTKIKLSMIDRGKIILPTLSGMAITIGKLVRGLIVLTLAITVKAILAWLLFIGAVGGYLIKSVLGYFRTKNKFEFGLTRSLYLKNLDNNSSVLFRILHEAEEQELMEAILCYMLLWNYGQSQGCDARLDEASVDEMVEAFLFEHTGVDVDFEIHDALGKLARLGLVAVDAQGRWGTIDLSKSVASLEENWEKIFRMRPLSPSPKPTQSDKMS